MIAFAIFLSVALICGTVLFGFKLWLDRIHPEQLADPTGRELLEELKKHRAEVTKELDAMNGRITFAVKPQLRR